MSWRTPNLCRRRCSFVLSSLLLLFSYQCFATIHVSSTECSLKDIIRVDVDNLASARSGSLEHIREASDGQQTPTCSLGVRQWHILGDSSSSSSVVVNLNIRHFKSLCTEGYLYVYDGATEESPMLFVTVGGDDNSTSKGIVSATSGSMLISLYVSGQSTFSASYSVDSCTQQCLEHGSCNKDGSCGPCHSGWTGEFCGVLRCPRDCHSSKGQGECNMNTGLCECHRGYSGDECSFPSNITALSLAGRVKAYVLTSGSAAFPSRSGHSSAMTTQDGYSLLWVFGGHSGQSVLDDLIVYDFRTSEWRHVNTSHSKKRPAGRYQHTMTAVGNTRFYVFGGELQSGVRVNEMWMFDITSREWSQLESNAAEPLSLHSMCLNHSSIVVFGGYNSSGELRNVMYHFDSATGAWHAVRILPESWFGLSERLRLAGHAAVVHEELNTMVVFGGFVATHKNKLVTSPGLFMFHLTSHYWMELPQSSSSASLAAGRAFHSATVFGKYMLIYGGLTTGVQASNPCSVSESLLIYDFTCYRWIPMSKLPIKRRSLNLTSSLQRYGHSASKLGDNRVVVMGGFAESAQNDLVAFQLPSALTSYDPVPDCYSRGNVSSCLDAVQCIWCPEVLNVTSLPAKARPGSAQCIPTALSGRVCLTPLSDLGTCHDLCSFQRYCSDCLKWRSGYDHHSRPVCSWCSQYDSTPSCRQVALQPSMFCDPASQCDVAADPNSAFSSPVHRPVSSASFSFTRPLSPTSPPVKKVVAYGGINPLSVGKHCRALGDNGSCVNRTAKVRMSVAHGSVRLDLGSEKDSLETAASVTALSNVSEPVESIFFVHIDDGWVWLRVVAESDPNTQDPVSGDINVTLVPGGRNSSPEALGGVHSFIEEPSIVAKSPSSQPVYFDSDSSLSLRSAPTEQRLPTTVPVPTVDVADVLSFGAAAPVEYSSAIHEPAVNTLGTLSAVPLAFHFYSDACGAHTDCSACVTNSSCGWCAQRGTCVHMSSTQIGSCPGPATFNGSSWIQDSASCLSCQHRDTCDACLDSIACEWNMNGFCQLIAPGTIGSIVASSSTVRMKQECPLPCPQRSRCDECMLGGFARPCVWCVSTGKCHDQAKMPLVNAYGQCRLYFSNSPDMCRNCSARTVCSDCLATPSAQDRFCGWCMDVSDPQSGRCMPGSFDGPSANETCDISSMDTRRVPVYANHTWSFTRCPAVDWCMLKNTSCGSNASCHNDVDSGYCHCDVGFTGDGLRCEEWCPVSCGRHGHCSGSPLFQCVCDLGWTGEVCGEDCECNGWSTCASGRGLCDDCQNNTAGKSCELCKPLHFRNATSDTCRQCVCSDREDMSVGGCNTTSGACYCSLGYAGEQCEKCESGYRFYQGKSESLCLKQCATRLVTHSTGTLQYVSTVHINPLLYSGLTHCALVIIAADAAAATATAVTASTPDASLHLTQDNVSQVVAPGLAIELTIHWLSLPCNNESVLVYDDLHLDTSSLANYTLIGMVSGQNNHALPGAKFYSVSGIMTVFLPVFNDDGDGVVVTHRSIPCMDCPQPQRSCVAQSEDTLVCDGLHTVSICRDCKYRCVNNSGQCRCLNTSSTAEGCSNPRTSPTQPGWANLSSSWLVPQELDNNHECTVSNPCPMTSFPPRYEHTAVCIRSTLEDLLYVFGGIDSTGRMLSADVAVVSTSSYTWHVLKMKAGKSQRGDNVITPRYAHSTVLSLQEQKMYVFGGVLENNVTTSELWELSLGIKKSTWTSLQQGSASPLGRAFHSLTMTATNGSRELLLLGGYAAINSSMKTIISCRTVHVYRLSQGVWVERQTQGPAPSVYGHTASYVKGEDGDVDSVVVLGGSQYLAGHVADGRTLSYSDDLVLFRLRLRDWTWEYILPTQPVPTFLRPLAVPSDISGHQSVTLYSHLIVVIGGSTLKRSPACSQLTVLLYNTKCAAFAVLNFSQQTDDFSIPYLEYHTATPSSSGHTAYVLGGVKNGLVSGDMAMFTVPDQLDTWCSLAMDETSCGALDSSCLWCSPQGHGDPYCVSKFSNTSHCGTPDDYENAVCADNSKCDSFHSCLGCVGRTGCLYNADQASSQCQTEENTSMGKKSLLSRWQDCPVAGTKCYLQAQCDKCLKSRTNCSSAALMYTRSGVMYPAQMCTVAARNDSIVLPVNNCSLTCSVECPVDCSAHTTCSACVESISYSAPPLSHQLQQPRCLWSASQQACMSLDESNVLCPGMRCGSIASQESQCPVIHCGRFKNCHSCRQALGCGWCRQPTGNGTCLSGGPSMPDTCRMFNSMYSRFSDFYARFPPNLISSNPWNYFTCPLVDECSTGTHNCPDTQICVDEDDGFGCACAPGFNNMNGQCVPVCPSDCGEYGQCVSPNVCKCDYHWTGSRCRTPCECNGHSDCQDATPAGVKTCLNCTNNTHGPQCNFCDAGYVDITLSNQPVTCVSCHKFCHWNSKTCNRLGNGTEPLRVDNTVCSDCSNNTHGDRCDKCDEGHFHSPSQPHYLMAGTYLCQRCRCNGHATGNCGKGGSECVCQNNTQSTECLDHASEMCYLYQCDRCRSAYIGTPVNGQQCYLLISSDDAFTEDIPYGGMRFFSIPPRYTNVDIRLTVVSHVGEVDVWLGTSDSDLSVESSQSVHYVFSKLLSANQGRATLCSRSWSASMNENTFNEPPTVVTVSEHGFRKCAFQGELVMRLPHSKHALHRQKFFLALRALSVHPNVSSRNRSTGVVPSHGTTVTVYYQQDLLQIDLIIFFSCFFSSFFLLLLVSMALWRFRAMYQAHVRRLQNVARREQNANRPFVQLKVLLPSEQAGNSGNVQVDGMQGGSALAARKHSIIAHQPIKDGKAWLSTSFIRLPSEDNGSHLALASAITLSPSDNSPLLAGLRRRAFNSYSAQLSRPWRQRQYQYDIAGDHGNGDPAL